MLIQYLQFVNTSYKVITPDMRKILILHVNKLMVVGYTIAHHFPNLFHDDFNYLGFVVEQFRSKELITPSLKLYSCNIKGIPYTNYLLQHYSNKHLTNDNYRTPFTKGTT